ncbi:hypothetical protein J2X69_002752 [Algoriphagus sp. 4150]|uniref:hypothetical protein n=1 Tax=Algoriphagus sp. 4150 TaxID=2817756 RepID=UPI0028613F4A|nr:hypothetical protein [Algoriphagus sp. 4150]MDR7130402.1 hypothetical protein [Algoriphagus sp. 4150]
MRHFWIGMIAVLFFTSCDKEEDVPFELTSEGLVGKWELYQYQGSTGAEDYRTAYEPTGKTITFLPNGNLRSVKFFECNEGEYEITDHVIAVLFDCEEEVPERTYFMKRENGDLVFSPRTPSVCIEGCAFIFKRIE